MNKLFLGKNWNKKKSNCKETNFNSSRSKSNNKEMNKDFFSKHNRKYGNRTDYNKKELCFNTK